jgi:aspartate/methionine/tyrosine aminotransferase
MNTAINLAVGDPSGAPHPALIEAFLNAVNEPEANHYASPKGLASTRSAAASYYFRRHGVSLDPKCVTITHGARPALQYALSTSGRKGQPCGYFEPAYTYFTSIIEGAGLRPLPILLMDRELTSATLSKSFEQLRGGVLLINNPHNPTGRIFGRSELLSVVEVCRDFDIKIVSDAVYIDLYENDRPSSLIDIEPTAVEVISVSKPHRACGYRAGAIVGNPAWIESFTERYAVMNGVPHAVQRVAEFAWLHMPGVEEFRRELVTRRAVVVRALRDVGFAVDTDSCNISSMFVWARLPKDSPPAHVVVNRCASYGVQVSNGEAFGAGFGRFIRVALNEPDHQLAEAMSRLSFAMEKIDEIA